MNRQSAQREPRHDPSIILHGPQAFAAMRAAGRLAAELLDYITPHIVPGVATGELDRLVEQYTRDRGGISAPLGYKGFPKSVCISVNHVVCHGIPGDRVLANGDIVNIDVTPLLEGWHGDSSRMYLVGDKVPLRARKLVDVTYDAMMLGIAAIKPGATLGDVGHAIQSFVEANRFSVVRDFCGHGTGQTFHVAPSVLHYGRPGEGIELQAGMIFTVEPMVNSGRHEVKVLDDGWTAVTRDRSLSAQFEHTVGVTEDGVEIFTLSPAGFTKPPYPAA
jgi:methionyl aminopeptidase